MRAGQMFVIPVVAVSLALAACGSSSSSSSSPAQTGTPSAPSSTTAAVVHTASNSTLHATVLVDSQGRTLYHLSGEGSGKFICTSSACLQVWHPLAAAAAAASTGSLGTVTRPDGTQQLTYKGMPLYTFAQDGAGEAKGEGVKDVGTWTAVVVSPSSGSAPTATETSTSSSSSSGGGYHY